MNELSLFEKFLESKFLPDQTTKHVFLYDDGCYLLDLDGHQEKIQLHEQSFRILNFTTEKYDEFILYKDTFQLD